MTTNSTQGAMVAYHPVASSSDAYALVNATSTNVINTTNGDANPHIPHPWRVMRVHSVEHATTLVEADIERLAHRRPHITTDGTIADLAARS
jgi:hypothetical protein